MRQIIASFQEYKELLSMAKQREWRDSNCYFLPAAIKQKIEQRSLIAEILENGLLLLEDNGSFYRCYYYFSRTAKAEELDLDKDAVIELPYYDTLAEPQERQIARIHEMGFRLGRRSGMMLVGADAVRIKQFSAGFRVRTSAPEDQAQIFQLFRQSFNPLFAYLPSENQLADKIKRNLLFEVRESGNIVGALNAELDKQTATIEQIAVDGKYRGKGAASCLLNTYHSQFQSKVKRFRLWINADNAAVYKMYSELGYVFSGKRANEYTKISMIDKGNGQ